MTAVITLSGRIVHNYTRAAQHQDFKRLHMKLEGEMRVRRLWRYCDAVCFDVDSTVCQDEAIDELADFCGVGEEVKEATIRAMNGGLSFRRSLTERLSLIHPTVYQIEEFVRRNPPRLTPGIRQLTSELQRRQIPVYLVSGGFSRMILPVARFLRIPEENVFANVLRFDEEGNYAGFDESQPTSYSGGKAAVCGMLKQRFGYRRLVMVGDGATDLEAYPPADAFVGFGGNEIRERVRREAKWFTMSMDELLLELLQRRPGGSVSETADDDNNTNANDAS